MNGNDFGEKPLDLGCLDPAPGDEFERVADSLVARILAERARRPSWLGILVSYARWGAAFAMGAAVLILALSLMGHETGSVDIPAADRLLSWAQEEHDPSVSEILELGAYPEEEHDAW